MRAKRVSNELALGLALVTADAAWAQMADAVKAPAPCRNLQRQVEAISGASTQTYRVANGRDLRIHVFTPQGPGPHPAALFFFGGGWNSGQVTHFQDQARALQKRGYVTAISDYRVFCRDQTTPDSAVEDALAAYAWLRGRAAVLGIDKRRIVVSGGSAGGHLAALIGALAPAGEKPAAMVLFNPVVDLTLRPIVTSVRMSDERARAISPAVLPKKGLPPAIIFHGTADQTVPIESVRAYCTAIIDAGGSCDLQAYADAPHGFFNRRPAEAVDGQSFYADTLAKTERFLAAQRISPPATPTK